MCIRDSNYTYSRPIIQIKTQICWTNVCWTDVSKDMESFIARLPELQSLSVKVMLVSGKWSVVYSNFMVQKPVISSMWTNKICLLN